ncbi:endonuclease domain-containing protein [Streptomyces sp. NPDC093509]|uniref:endonuclease domain-containing protein n=1 Tax=Streptomyces sp. NPDC093509 TaxID=3154982 RepID=UPI00344C5F77
METDCGPEEARAGRVDDFGATGWDSLAAEWTIREAGPGVDPGIIDRSQRCIGGDHPLIHLWPPRPARAAAVRRLCAALVDALGTVCHLCGHYPVSMIDHDHQTGEVRGLLCACCNRVLEECPHLTYCPRADYMLLPPAAALNLLYPASLQWRPKESTRRYKIQLLGFDPFEGLHRAP